MEKKKRGNPNIRNIGFGSRPRAVDDEYRSRIKGVPKKIVWTDAKICEFIDEMLTVYKRILIDEKKINKKGAKLKSETIRDMNNMMNRLLLFKEKYYPTIQKNVNLNIDMTSTAVLERLKNWKKGELNLVEDEDDN